MEFQTGKLLIATPELTDPNFFRTVSLIFHHSSEGAAGVILNRPSNTSIGDVWEDLQLERDVVHAIHVGGPVEGPLMALHTNVALAENSITPGVFLSFSRDHLNQLVSTPNEKVKVFSGYAGWGEGQLEAEMKAGGWLTFPTEIDDIFEAPDELWKIACQKVGNQIMFASSPFNPSAIDPLAN